MLKLEKELELHEVEFHRREDCAHYEDCLDDTALKRWKSFSCFRCEKYLFKPIDTVELSNYYTMEEDYPEGAYDCGKNSKFGRKLRGKMRGEGIKEFNVGHRVTG